MQQVHSVSFLRQFHLLGESMVQSFKYIERKQDKYPKGLSHSVNICPWIDLGFLYFPSSIPPLFTHGAAGA